MKYSKNQLQNLDVLVYNWESLFSKKYLNEDDGLNKNYLLPILLLKNFYTQNGRVEEAANMQNLAQQISLRFSIEKQIKKHLDWEVWLCTNMHMRKNMTNS